MIVVEQNEGRSLARDIGPAPTHGDADVGSLEGGSVVHAVARHGDDFAARLDGIDDAQLLLGHRPREDRCRAHTLGEFCLAHLLEIASRNDIARFEVRAERDCTRGLRVIAGDHDDPDASGLALLDGLGYCRTRRICDPYKAQILEWETTRGMRTSAIDGTEALARPSTRMPSRAISSAAERSRARSSSERWQSSAMASAAPFAATINAP